MGINEHEDRMKEKALFLSNLGKEMSYAVRDCGSIPEGHLYSSVMNHVSLGEFKMLVGLMLKGGLVSKSNNVLRWIAG